MSQTLEDIDADTIKVLRRARNRLQSVSRKLRQISSPDDRRFIAFLSRPQGVACWFHAEREPQFHTLAQQFESNFETGEVRAAVIAEALRVW